MHLQADLSMGTSAPGRRCPDGSQRHPITCHGPKVISAFKMSRNLDDQVLCRRTEVVNLLESAGFSRANPYYVVQQGKVRAS